ncbi:MAG: hypothetical protein WD696_17555 [Bryobacteraceae bacterium]
MHDPHRQSLNRRAFLSLLLASQAKAAPGKVRSLEGGLAPLIEAFNRDKHLTRLVLLLSPT